MTQRCDFVFVSLTKHDESGDDRSYLEWHQLEHMPEKYQYTGITGGQRWISTSACRAARSVEVGDWTTVAHFTTYLMAEPIEDTVDDFLGVGRELSADAPSLPKQYQGTLKLVESHVASRIRLPGQVLPFRPNHGVYVVVEEPTDEAGWDDYLGRVHPQVVRELLAVPGVAGAWVLVSAPELQPREIQSPGQYCMTVYYLDDDPAEVGARLAEPLGRSWDTQPTRPLLGAPFQSMLRLDWDSFGPGKDEPRSRQL